MFQIKLFGRFVANAADRSQAEALIEEHKRNRSANRTTARNVGPDRTEEIPDEYEIVEHEQSVVTST